MNTIINKNIKKFFSVTMAILILLGGVVSYASSNSVVTYGKDLNSQQRQEVGLLLGVKPEDKIIEVTNAEEREYLGHLIDSKVLGSRAISSSRVEPTGKDTGIEVETKNITWVTEDMIISALATAGVKDAKVVIASPFDVSGTAALTGVMKGFESATGQSISEEEKAIANEEIAKTGELADEIGKDEASTIMNKVKAEVIEKDISDPEEIKGIIDGAAQEINITLTEEQKAQIAELMEKISNLDINVEDIKSQLKNTSEQLKELLGDTEEVKGILNQILDFVKGIFYKIGNVFKSE